MSDLLSLLVLFAVLWCIGQQFSTQVQLTKQNGKIDNVISQLGRIVSDIESEKGTRKRIHDDFNQRLRKLELP